MNANISVYFRLFLCALVPVIFSIIIQLLIKKTKFGRIGSVKRQIIIGLFFGLASIIGTECGVNIGGATANARDAAPVAAGLLFGPYAGIIAGVIGGVERWIAVAWGAGIYSQLACSLSTILAGFYAALLRKYLFDNKRPTWGFSLVSGGVMEIIHLTILFITHLNDPYQALHIVQLCTGPMVLCNAVAVMLSSIAAGFIYYDYHFRKASQETISRQVQRPLLFSVIAAFLLATGFSFSLQTNSARTNAEDILSQSITDIEQGIRTESDETLIAVAHEVAADISQDPYTKADLKALARKYNVTDIWTVNKKGIIVGATDDNLGYDMASDSNLPKSERQSSNFLVLLKDKTEYAEPFKALANNSKVKRKIAGVSLSQGGFVQVAQNSKQFMNSAINHTEILTDHFHVGENGYTVIADSDQKLVTDSSKSLKDIGINIKTLKNSDKIFEGTVKNRDSYYMFSSSEGFITVAVIPTSDVYETRDIFTYVFAYMEILIYALLFLVIYLIIRRVVVNRLREVNSKLALIIDGDLETVVDVRESQEFASLSDDINSTVETLKHYIDEAAHRLDQELAFAEEIQHSALPSVFPPFPERKEFDIYACMDTAKAVGGDFYDFYMLRQNRVGFLIADVSGKGIPAALFMMRAKSVIKSLAETGMDVGEVATKANNVLCEGNEANMFVTVWLGFLDTDTGMVTFANAGHNRPIIYRKETGLFEYLDDKRNLVMGGMEGLPYKEQSVQLQPGDKIFLYTDGVTEATNNEKELYGDDRLVCFLNKATVDNGEKMTAEIRADIDTFAEGAEQADDITMLVMTYIGKEDYSFSFSGIESSEI